MEADSTNSIRWIVAQDGSRQSYAVPMSFHRLGQLRLMYTDVWCRWGRSVLRCGPSGARALATRFTEQIPGDRVISFNARAILARALSHFSRGTITASQQAEEFIRFGTWFSGKMAHHLSTLELSSARDLFFGFNTNCLETLEALRKRNIVTVVDQVDPGEVEEDIVHEEIERWPNWQPHQGRYPKDYWDRLREEWRLASLVLVNSEWSAEALVRQGVPRSKLITVPLAIDLSHDHPLTPIDGRGDLRVLWLGSVILRKGIQYLVEAARRLQRHKIEFLLAGPIGVSEAALRSFPSNLKLLGRVTRDQLSEVYRRAHVFVLPTVSDGYAVTQLEAMAHGLPVIVTPNCGRVVTHGFDGLVVPPRDSLALAEAISFLDSNRDRLREMSGNALRTVLKYDLPSNATLINDLVVRHQVQGRQGARA